MVDQPVAELRGWERLLAGDVGGAAREGRELGAFVDHLPNVAANAWWRELLGAESAVMTGARARAIDLARSAARPASGTFTFPQALHVRMMSARVLVWAGDADGALAILETLARGYPGAGPASIVRDPFFTMRFSSTPRWRALQQTLDDELAANQVLLR